METKNIILLAAALVGLCCLHVTLAEDAVETETVTIDPEQVEYAKGSLCQYCDYCEFCNLCDEDCPCETSPTKPNCKMCKYCKFCYLCKACDVICQPGGIIDKVSSSIAGMLDMPSYDKDEVKEDIESVKEWTEKKQEL